MKTNQVTILDVARVAQNINRVIKHASVYGIAKGLNVTPPRAKRLIDNALNAGVVHAYRLNKYSRGTGIRYSITDAGITCIEAIQDREESRLL